MTLNRYQWYSLVGLTEDYGVTAVVLNWNRRARNHTSVATRGAARLFELKVDEGANVTKGELLARLENDDLKSSLAVVQAKESFANQGLKEESTARKARRDLRRLRESRIRLGSSKGRHGARRSDDGVYRSLCAGRWQDHSA